MGTHLVLAKTETGSRLKHFYEFPPFRRGPLLVLLVIDSACKDSGRTALSRGSAGATERNGAPTRNELGRRRAGTWERNGTTTRDGRCMHRAAHVGCPESTVQPRSKERRMAGTRMCDGLPTGAGLGSRIVPGRDGGRRHAQMCSADGVEGAPGRHGTIEMEP